MNASLAQGTASHRTGLLHLQAGQVEVLGLRDSYWVTVAAGFLLQSLLAVRESSTIRMCVFVIE